jgi:hypothetical protein
VRLDVLVEVNVGMNRCDVDQQAGRRPGAGWRLSQSAFAGLQATMFRQHPALRIRLAAINMARKGQAARLLSRPA